MVETHKKRKKYSNYKITLTIVEKCSILYNVEMHAVYLLPTSQAAQSRCTVVRPIQKSIGKWEIRPPVKS